MNWSTSTPSSSEGAGGARGFTLVEMTVALAIVSLLLLTVYGVFSALSGARQRLQTTGEGYHQARVLFDRLGREIQGAFMAGDRTDVLFQGGETAAGQPFLTLATTAVTPVSGGQAIARVHYELTEDRERQEGQQVLLRRESPLFLDPDESAPASRLATDIVAMDLRFLAGGGRWHEAWNGARDGLPRMVEITLQIDAGDGREALAFRTAFELPAL